MSLKVVTASDSSMSKTSSKNTQIFCQGSVFTFDKKDA